MAEYSRLEQKPVIIIWAAENCKQFTEEYASKSFTNGLNMGLPLQARMEKTAHGVETH